MQYKNIKNQSKKQGRRAHERIGAAVLLMATTLSLATISHDTRRALREIALRPAITIITNSGRENETARIPVRYDSVLKLQTIGGR